MYFVKKENLPPFSLSSHDIFKLVEKEIKTEVLGACWGGGLLNLQMLKSLFLKTVADDDNSLFADKLTIRQSPPIQQHLLIVVLVHPSCF